MNPDKQDVGFPSPDATFEEFTKGFPKFLPAVFAGLNCIVDLATSLEPEKQGPDMVIAMLTGSISKDLHDILLLCMNDRRQSALKLIRSPYEKLLYASYISKHPETGVDFLQYDAIQATALLNDIEKAVGPAISVAGRKILNELYKAAQEKFKRSRCALCGESGPRMWTKVTPEQMAKEAGVADVYSIAYRYSTLAIHPTFRGITDQTTSPVKVTALLSMVHRITQETLQQQWMHFNKSTTATGEVAVLLRGLSECSQTVQPD